MWSRWDTWAQTAFSGPLHGVIEFDGYPTKYELNRIARTSKVSKPQYNVVRSMTSRESRICGTSLLKNRNQKVSFFTQALYGTTQSKADQGRLGPRRSPTRSKWYQRRISLAKQGRKLFGTENFCGFFRLKTSRILSASVVSNNDEASAALLNPVWKGSEKKLENFLTEVGPIRLTDRFSWVAACSRLTDKSAGSAWMKGKPRGQL